MLSNERSHKADKNWIDPLRKNSWEMELLITGFVLIALLQVPDALEQWGLAFLSGRSQANFLNLFLSVFLAGLVTGVKIITVNLVILLLIRGFWVGMIGLSSVYPNGIEPNKLHFSERFAKNLGQNTLDSDAIIVRLDNWCSSVFALSFLFLFGVISFGIYLLQIAIFGRLFDELDALIPQGGILDYLNLILMILVFGFYIIGALLKSIDYATAGGLKRIKNRFWIRIYYPWSQFISYASLGILYRPIYYIFASNINQRVITGIFLIYMGAMFVLFLRIDFRTEQIYFPSMWRNGYELSNGEYENLSSPEDGIIDGDMIQSDVIKDGYIKLFLYYDISENDSLKIFCPGINPLVQNISAELDISINGQSIFDNREITEEDTAAALDCFSSYYKIVVNDSTYTNLEYIFHRHRFNGEPGLLTYLSVTHLPTGFYKLGIYRGNDEYPNWIQFWKQ